MNPIAEEIRAIVECSEDSLTHYGMPRRSGRYPWGSGEDPYQRNRDFAGRVELLKKNGWKETPENIKKEFGLSTTQYRAQLSFSNNLRRLDKVVTAERLRENGLNTSEIGRQMGIRESSVRTLLDPHKEENMMKAINTAEFIREQINNKGVVDVGGGVERELGVSREKMNAALTILESEGYVIRGGRVDQATNPGQKTTTKVIGPPGTPKNAAYDYENIHSLNDYASHDGGETFNKFVYPKSMDSKRLMVRYAEDGGDQKDGIIELRRGVKDLSLGDDHYSQVRILVDDNRYLKGMAIYSDDMPSGVDVIFNTNKTKDVAKMDVLKDANKNLKKDPDNPFGSVIKPNGQSYYVDDNGKRQLSLINKRASEGDWSEWKDAIPSQFLAKQSLSMAKKQLGMAYDDKNAEYKSIQELNNPTIKKHLLRKFADECDSAAVHLQAAALPGQKYRVIIPVNSLKDTEVYAPSYENGTKLALIRYPHGGTFEIPIVTVNNKHAGAKKALGKDSKFFEDAVCINKKVADRLSGADFDGDTVMCIPTHDPKGRVRIISKDPLKDLEGFDPKFEYGGAKQVDSNGKERWFRNGKEYKIMNNTQTEMGIISNLITDMTLLGASDSEKARAVKHSMVVIDAEKHHLDYKQSEIDNDIKALKKKYQTGGASTLISRAKGQAPVLKRQGSPIINHPDAVMVIDGKRTNVYDPNKPLGSLLYKTADDVDRAMAKVSKRSVDPPNATIRVNAKGKRYVQFDDLDDWTPIEGKSDLGDGTRVKASMFIKKRTQQSTKMAETDDPYTLVSEANTSMERAYASHALKMKTLANTARMELVGTGKIAFNAQAKKTYAKEVKSLMEKLNDSELNRPRERMANIKARAEVNAKKRANPNMTNEDIKKASQNAITKYRAEMGSIKRSDRNINITDDEWTAIQAGAISESYLQRILNNTDVSALRQRATPKAYNTLSTSKINRIQSLSASGYSIAEIAKKVGCSVDSVSKYMKGAN